MKYKDKDKSTEHVYIQATIIKNTYSLFQFACLLS